MTHKLCGAVAQNVALNVYYFQALSFATLTLTNYRTNVPRKARSLLYTEYGIWIQVSAYRRSY